MFYILRTAFAAFGDRAVLYVALIVAGFLLAAFAPKLRIPIELVYVPPCVYIVCELFVDVVEMGVLGTSNIIGLCKNIGDECLMLAIGIIVGMIVANMLYSKKHTQN